MMDDKDLKIKKKKKVEKEHDPVGTERVIVKVAVVLLVIMAATLLFLLFYDKDSALVVPDEPSYKEIEMSVIDFTKDKININVMETSEKDDVPVRYTTVSDFYKNNILMSNVTTEYINERLIVRSREYSSMAFVASVTLKGEYEWDIILDDNKFDNVYVNQVIYEDGYYYVFMTKIKNSAKTLEVIKLDKKGKQKGNLVIAKDVKESISGAYFEDGQFAIVTTDYKSFSVYYMNEKMKLVETAFSNEKSKVISVKDYILFEIAYFTGNEVNIILKNGKENVLISVKKDGTAVKGNIDAINKLAGGAEINVEAYNDGFLLYIGKKVYKLDEKYEVVNMYDYENLKLEGTREYYTNSEEGLDEDEVVENQFMISGIDVVNNFSVLKANTLFSNVYDIYDKHLTLKKRYVFDFVEYPYNDAVLLDTYFIDDKIYEVYSLGLETPSIMISVLG